MVRHENRAIAAARVFFMAILSVGKGVTGGSVSRRPPAFGDG
jgi:hypothetical protein